MTPVSQAIEMIKQFEGCRLQAYPDPASGGDPWTIGYGATGPGIGPGVTWTQDQAEHDLNLRVTDLYEQVDELVHVRLPDSCVVALTSFAYNVGVRALQESTLLRMVNAGYAAAAADEFRKWTHAAGHIMRALVDRRERERQAFLAGLEQSVGTV